jgi:hypothetical protein
VPRHQTKKLSATLTISVAVTSLLLAAPSSAKSAGSKSSLSQSSTEVGRKGPVTSPAGIADPDAVLAKGWKSAEDVALTTDGDSTGLHVLVAEERDGYSWRTAATLTEPGVDTDEWIGQACVTGSGRRAAVVYAPRQIVNNAGLFSAGALAAIVDLRTGAVTKLPTPVSIAYHDPGCGVGETVTFSSRTQTRHAAAVTLVREVNASTGRVMRTITTPGQVTSAVPMAAGVAAVRGHSVVSLAGDGTQHVLSTADATPEYLTPDSAGGVAYTAVHGSTVELHRLVASKDSEIGSAPVGSLQVQGSGGRVFVSGDRAQRVVRGHVLPASWRVVAVPASAQLSSQGALAVTSATSRTEAAGRNVLRPDSGGVQPVAISAQVVGSAKHVSFKVTPAALQPAAGGRPSPALSAPATSGVNRPNAKAAATDPSTVTTDPDRTCAITRNDPKIQTLQPSPAMGEWAVDLAVQNALTVSRPANWNNDGLPAYTPQGPFPQHPVGSPVRVPAQIMLGIVAQESNMWQASSHAVDGETGNFEQGGYYGIPGELGIDWANADCGYGMAQVTTGMRLSDGTSVYSATQQKAIAVDYAANVAAGLQILQDKWAQLKAAGMLANGGDPKYLENWWFALWAYNTGYHAPGEGANGAYGLGWSNNPVNPDFPAGRAPFLTQSYDDAKHPNQWSYPERIMGWANTPLLRADYKNGGFVSSYTAGSWPQGIAHGEPPLATFCSATGNSCDTSKPHKPGDYPDEPAGACQRDDLECWWHSPATWVSCASYCGIENLHYHAGDAEPARPVIYPPNCTTVPAGAVVVDDVPDSVPAALGCPGRTVTSQGALSFKFASTTSSATTGSVTTYPSKVDLHQIGAGFGGHFWFTHTEPALSKFNFDPTKLQTPSYLITGTWTPTTRLSGWTRVMVHIPDHGDFTQQAHYRISLGNGTVEDRFIPTDIEKNSWVSLGVFNFVAGTSPTTVSLNNVAGDGDGTYDVAWDAAAFVHLTAKPKDVIVQLGDSYTSGEGAGSYDPVSNRAEPNEGKQNNSGTPTWNACRRSANSWIRKTTLPARSAAIGSMADSTSAALDLHTLACSGAKTNNLDPAIKPSPTYGDSGENHEIPQLEAGFLDANTTLVTLTIGGNDASFGSTIGDCAGEPLTSCPSDATVHGNIDKAMPNVLTTLKDIHAKAPNAKIILMGYPRLFNTAKYSTCDSLMGKSEMTSIDSWADYMTSKQTSTAALAKTAGVPVTFYSPDTQFNGYRKCDTVDGINDYVQAQNGPSDYHCGINPICPSRESYHPNSSGTPRYALAFAAAAKAAGV